jgi:hypothetical protein
MLLLRRATGETAGFLELLQNLAMGFTLHE